MMTKLSFFCGLIVVLAGCESDQVMMPEIVDDPAIELKAAPPEVPGPAPMDVWSAFPSDWLPPPDVEKKWTAIVIHHSATENGNAAIFDRMHREENHWDGVGYDFVIGNGTDSGDGQIEVTFRWRRQVPGAHCGGTPDNWANVDAVGICLVGDFNHSAATARQMQSLVELVRFLQKRYDIPTSRIYGHNTAPGARPTDCPGRISPIPELRHLLRS